MPRSKKIKNDSKLQRRMDSLARVLSVSIKETACNSVALIEDRFLIALNTPRKLDSLKATDKEKQEPIEKEKIQGMVKEKLRLLRKFIDLAKGKSKDEVKKLALDHAHLIYRQGGFGFITDTFRVMMEKKWDEFSITMINNRKSGPTNRIATDLAKLAISYYAAQLGHEDEGFTLTQADLLMHAQPNFIFPDFKKETETRLKVHADQLLPMMIKELYESNNIQHTNEIPIGINKLSCQACEDVLDHDSNKFSYRGRSGVSYPNVFNTRTNERHPHSENGKSNSLNLYADDSDSEPELDTLLSFQSRPYK